MADEIHAKFRETYLAGTPFELIDYRINTAPHATEVVVCEATIRANGEERRISGRGNGPINAFVQGFRESCGVAFRLADYHQHAVTGGSDAEAACFIKLSNADGREMFGVGLDANTNTASFKAIVSAVNRMSSGA